MSIEQVNNGTGAVTYLHHDQSGSTRLLTGSMGKVEGAYTYTRYGAVQEHTGTATTPLGYDDPLVGQTRAPYYYAGDNPLNEADPSGRESLLGEAIAGWGDTITFGGTKWVREQIGDENVDTCSGAYQAGGYSGLVTAVLIPGDGEAEVGADGARIAESAAEPIFRDAEGHLAEDTPENRALIESVVKPENYVRTGGEGDVLYRETLSNGTQAWAKVFNGAITNGGLNQVPFP